MRGVTCRWREALPSSYYRINGLNTITLSVTCETGSNILRVSEAVREEMSRLQASFPPQITASLSYDASRYISDELDKIYSRTLWCLAILLVFVFLVSRDVRYLVMITVTLAVNLLVAVVFYNLLDVGIHIYSLAGITVSLGIMIDTAIIMVDHYSYYHNRRVFTSILGALLTTIGALGIVWLLPEDQQANLTDFSLVIIMMIPISFIGVFLTFGLFDFRFDQGGFAAFVLLCGIVVNAGIYLITEYDECRRTSSKQGLQLYLMAFNHKIVPISLTILSTILGLVPFLYDGPEEVFWFAFAMAAISGTAFSILALIIYLPIFMPLGERTSTGSVHDYGTRNVCSDVGPNRSA